jgi:hypothetical protein
VDQVLKRFVILLSVFMTLPAQALVEVPTFRLGLGHSFVTFTAKNSEGNSILDTESASLGSLVTLSPSFLWDIPQLRSRMGFHFLADVGSEFGFVSIIGVGVTYLFYPLGLSSSREVKDDGSVLVKTRVSPYFNFQFTPSKMSITVPSNNPLDVAVNRRYFNVSVNEVSLGAGLDYPIADNTVLFGGINYRFASYTSDEADVGSVTYSGLFFNVGIMTNFY